MFEGAFSPWHWLVVLVIVLLIFGPKKLPEVGKGLGTAIRGFKEGLKGMSDEIQASDKDPKPEEKPSPSKPDLKG
ncbi:MAG: twin-arginine translocase TatA/TatE family subunit [Thermoanaerobaculaceae bacterium]|jgi:sec-independent protein translocase protein TatA